MPKPDPGPYRRLVERHGLAPAATAMVEDMAKNLKPAHELGMTTVWVRTDSDWALPADDDPPRPPRGSTTCPDGWRPSPRRGGRGGFVPQYQLLEVIPAQAGGP